MGNPCKRLISGSAWKSRCTSPIADSQRGGSPCERAAADPTREDPRAGIRRRRRLSAVELQLPQLRRRAQRHAARAGAHAVVDRRAPAAADNGVGAGQRLAGHPAQLRANPVLQPGRAVRDSAIAAIVLVDGQIDHTTGLYMLREVVAAVAAVVHRQRVRRSHARQSRCSTCSRTTAASSGTASSSTATTSRSTACSNVRWRALPRREQAGAVFAAPRAAGARRQHRARDHGRSAPGERRSTRRASARSTSDVWRTHATRRLRAGRRHVLDR